MDAKLQNERDFEMNVNSANVNNQYNQFDSYVLGTGASPNGSDQKNTQLQEQIDEYIQDTFSFGNKETEAEKYYRETLERLQAFAKQFFLDSIAKDRTFVPLEGPKPGDDIAIGRAVLPGKMPHIDDFMSPELKEQPTGMYDPIAATARHNALIGALNDWSRATDEYYKKAFSDEILSQLWVAEMPELPKGELIRFEDMDPERLVSVWGYKQQADSD
jgi:hypothetical protein